MKVYVVTKTYYVCGDSDTTSVVAVFHHEVDAVSFVEEVKKTSHWSTSWRFEEFDVF